MRAGEMRRFECEVKGGRNFPGQINKTYGGKSFHNIPIFERIKSEGKRQREGEKMAGNMTNVFVFLPVVVSFLLLP